MHEEWKEFNICVYFKQLTFKFKHFLRKSVNKAIVMTDWLFLLWLSVKNQLNLILKRGGDFKAIGILKIINIFKLLLYSILFLEYLIRLV
jgi:hypothetical protein